MKMKKLLKVAMVALMVPMLLTGCIYGDMTVDIKENGSGKVKMVVGSSKQILDQIGKKPNDFSGKNNKWYEFESGGMKYLGETWEDAFRGPEDMNTAGVGTLTGEFGWVQLQRVDGGLKLNVSLREEFGPNMTTDRKLPALKDMTDKGFMGMKLKDVIAQDVKGLRLKAQFNMPYPVKQVLGGTQGVTVKGNTIYLDYLKMIDSGQHQWNFESMKNPNAPRNKTGFKDVKTGAWYENAVVYAMSKGYMKGFEDGTFKPNNPITLAEVAKIASEISGSKIPNNPQYWAMGHVMDAQSKGFVLSNSAPTAKNWNVPATREQAVYAVALASGKGNVGGNLTSVDIRGWDNIDTRMHGVVLSAYNAGLVKGGSADGSFNAKSLITRAEITQILDRVR